MSEPYHETPDETVKLLVPLAHVPNEAVVTKRTGTYTYQVLDSIKIFGAPEHQEVKAMDGTRFLAGRPGRYNAHPGDLLVIWHASVDDVYEYLQEQYGETPK